MVERLNEAQFSEQEIAALSDLHQRYDIHFDAIDYTPQNTQLLSEIGIMYQVVDIVGERLLSPDTRIHELFDTLKTKIDGDPKKEVKTSSETFDVSFTLDENSSLYFSKFNIGKIETVQVYKLNGYDATDVSSREQTFYISNTGIFRLDVPDVNQPRKQKLKKVAEYNPKYPREDAELHQVLDYFSELINPYLNS